MKLNYSKNTVLKTYLLLLLSFISGSVIAQQMSNEAYNHRYFYISSAFISSNSINHASIDPYYSASNQFGNHRTLRFDVGVSFVKNTSFEVGYLGNWLDYDSKLIVDGNQFAKGSHGSARISYYSFVFVHNFNLYKNRIFLSPGLGYAIGDYSELPTWPRTQPESILEIDHTITTSSISNALTDKSGKYLVMKIGIEVAVFRKLNFFSKVFLYNGMVDLMERETTYTINQDNGSYKITSDGTTQGIELGLKFSFR